MSSPFTAVAAQSAGQPAFEAATIKVDTSIDPESGDYQHGRFTIHNAPLKDIIIAAYDFKRDLVQGGPNWIKTARYDVSAKADPTTSDAASRLMLRTLLAERFHLRVHNEERPTSVLVLQVSKNGPKLHPPDDNSPFRSGCFSSEPLVCHNVTLAALAGALRSNGTGIDIPVLDETGIEGRHDIRLEYVLSKSSVGSPDPATPAGGVSSGPGIFDALERLGLKLQNAKRPMQILVIDHVEPLVPEN